MRFDVYRSRHHDSELLLLDVQADLLEDLRSRLVVPLSASSSLTPLRRLQPAFEIEGRRYVMLTTDMAAISVTELGSRVTSLSAHHVEIVAAIDFLLRGF